MKKILCFLTLIISFNLFASATVFETDPVIGSLPSILSERDGVKSCSFDRDENEKLMVNFFDTGLPTDGGLLKFELGITCTGDELMSDLHYKLIGFYDVTRGGLTLESLSYQ